MDANLLGDAVVRKREELHLTQEGLVSLIGEDKISLSTVKRIERRITVSLSKAYIVASALGIDISEYMSDS